MNDLHRDLERLYDNLAAYALDALEAEEAAQLRTHLEGCGTCRGRLMWLMPAVDQLPAAVEQRTPPESLRESLMATVRAEAAPQAAKSRGPVPQRRTWWDGLRGAMLRPATGMAVLIVLVVGVAGGYLLRGSDTAEPQRSSLVKAEAINGSVPVSATLERTGDSATLHVHELPVLNKEDVYEVWVQRAGVMEPRSTFVLNSDGTAEAAVPGPLDGADGVFVTREPRGGSRQPTTDPLLQAPLE